MMFGIFSFLFFNLGMYIYAYITPGFDIKQLNKYYIYDINGDLLNIAENSDSWVSLDNISQYLIDATIISEDKKFYTHGGFDFLRIGVVAVSNIMSNSFDAGASTITQQYARNIFLDFDKTWERKIKEALLTFELETHFTKDEILEGYLNTINYGGVYGISDAALYYFDKDVSELTLSEATILASIPKSPSYYSPINNEDNNKYRQNIILTMMVNENVISAEDKLMALEEEIVYVGEFAKYDSITINYYKDAVLSELKNVINLTDDFLQTGGFKIYTNFDPLAQDILEDSMKNNLVDTTIQISAVLSNPNTGQVYGILGGTDYELSQFNRVTDSKRQVGSTMKTYLYYAALENGFTASSTFLSQPTTFVFSNDDSYSPINYGETYSTDPISLAAALAYSDNIYAVKTHLFLGQNVLIDTARRVGITSNLEEIASLPLGTNEISILEMVGGYSAFASEGNKVTPYFITKVEDRDSNSIYEYKEDITTVLNSSITFILSELLANSTDSAFIDYNYPTCISMASKLTKKYAIKTGTTSTDTWAIGYNKDAILAVWIGYDDNQVIVPSEYSYVKNIWADVIERYLEDKDDNWYTQPKNVSGVLVNPISGEISTDDDSVKKLMYYIKGTEPYSFGSDLESVFLQDNEVIAN